MSELSDRFPDDVADVLRAAGWSGNLRTEEQTAAALEIVCNQVGRRGATLQVFDAAIRALAEFGGLYVSQDGPGVAFRRRPFALDPTQVAACAESLADFGRLLGTRLFPLGMEGDHDSILVIDESGCVFALDHAGDWFLGNSVEGALTTLITGTQPSRINDVGDW